MNILHIKLKRFLNIATLLVIPFVSKSQLILNQPNTTGAYSDPISVTLGLGFGSNGPFSASIGNSSTPPVQGGVFGNQNYLVSNIYRVPLIVATQSPNSDQIDRKISYFDGLGRIMQEVSWEQSPLRKDKVQVFSYDSFGNQSKSYLPYVETTINDGTYKVDAITKQYSYYTVPSTANVGVIQTTKAFAETSYENSPLIREIAKGSPGEAWQLATNRTVKTDYGTNIANSVKKWIITNTNVDGTSFFPANSLYRVTIYDENNPSKSRTGSVEEYKDTDGKLLLRRVWKSTTENIDTYFVYDILGNMRYIIPPSVSTTNFTESDSVFDDYVFGYQYDNAKRVIKRKYPGKQGWEYCVYNKLDQLVLTQDSIQRVKFEWGYLRYDGRGRVTSSGLYTNSNSGQRSLQQMQALVNSAIVPQWESRNMASAYQNQTFPISGTNIIIKELAINYYDDYQFADAASLPSSGVIVGKMNNGNLTGTKIYNDGGTDPLLSLIYYDDYGRIIQVASTNSLGGTDYVTNTYNFSNEVVSIKRDHKASSTGPITTILTTNVYDHRGRKTETRKKINSSPEVVQSRNQYNELGQLRQKDLHVVGTSSAQQIEYAYNERGWMKSINDPFVITELRRFGMSINYANKADAFNGNIGSINWNTKVSSSQVQTPVQSYIFSYDPLNRIVKAAYSGLNGKENFFNEELAYDKVGNIDSLRRSSGANSWFNNFKFSYDGNRLTKIKDIGTSNRTNVFDYNASGSLRSDSLRAISNIEYNFLNLPTRFTKGSDNLQYSYNAAGEKLSKTFAGVTTHYLNGIQYRNGALDFIQTEEGRIVPNGSSFRYEYFVKDHLGNVRAVVDNSGTLRQIQDYYAFGKEMNNGNSFTTTPNNLYKYNGKEKQIEFGLELLDYGTRFYDAEIGRFTGVDPVSEKFPNVSPYNYAENEPVGSIDLWGLQRWMVNGRERTEAMPGWKTDGRAIGVAIAHPVAAARIGSISSGSKNISSVAGRFARHFAEDTRTPKEPGSESNALRHALWSSMVQNEFDGKIARRVTNAHEGVGIGESQYVDMSVPFKGNDADLADHIVDVLNNNIGIGLSVSKPNSSTKDLATMALYTFYTEGLWTFSKDENGNVKIERKKISDKQYTQGLKTLSELDENGFSEEERKRLEEEKRRQEEQLKSMGREM